MNFISCGTWVKRGVAKSKPDVVQLQEEELAKVLADCKKHLSEEDGEDETTKKKKKKGNTTEEEDPISLYGLDKYDEEDACFETGNLTMFTSNAEDPCVTVKDKDYVDSDEEDFEIHPSDNLIVVGHVENDASTLDVYVCNDDKGYLYIHHDILLPVLPLCVEWLNHDPTEATPGNLVAVGSVSPVVEVWDIDVVNCLTPAYKLGKAPSKKRQTPRVGHTDAVMSLAWNSHCGHLLASGSADNTVLLWDLDVGTVASKLPHEEKVQSLQWHPEESQMLLTGCCDSNVSIYDFRTETSQMMWTVSGEVEKVLWDHFNPHCFLVSTEAGNVHYIDSRTEQPLWDLCAHEAAVTGIALSYHCRGCLVTVSSDKLFKLWDIEEGKPQFVAAKNFNIGDMSFIAACPDIPFLFCMGGDKRNGNFYVWNICESELGRSRFQHRQKMKSSHVNTSAPGNEVAMETESAAAALESLSLSKNNQKTIVDKTRKSGILKQQKKKKVSLKQKTKEKKKKK